MRLLISGYVGAGNLGDEALLSGLVGALRTRGVEPLVASVDPARTDAEHRVQTVDRSIGLLGAIARVDAVVSGGGGLLQDVTSFRSLAYYLGVIAAARALRTPVAVFAQSLGPLSPRGAAATRRVLRGVPLGLRDAPSLALAAGWGLPATSVADTALLVEPPTAPEGDGSLVVVPRAGYPTLTDALVRLAAPWANEGGRVVVACIHPSADGPEAERLVRALPAAVHTEAATVGAVLNVFAGARAVLSGRLHGMVLAAHAGTPVAGIAYDPKVSGFAERIGAPVAPLPTNGDPEGSLAALRAFVAAPRLDEAAVADERARASAGVDWLLDVALHAPSAGPP